MENQFEQSSEISRFLEKYNQEESVSDTNASVLTAETPVSDTVSSRQEQYNQSFEKLEEKILELEEKFAASTAQSEAVMQELSRTRQVMETQQGNNSILANITTTIAHLKESVDNLSRTRQTQATYEATPTQTPAYDTPASSLSGEYMAMSFYKPDNYRAAEQAKIRAAQAETEKVQTALDLERAEKGKLIFSFTQERQAHEKSLSAVKQETKAKERIIASLQQKTSQLKAVNNALDREVKRAQQDRLEALRKSAEQAKEILSLRDALTAAEERFKSFDFEGRIISVRHEYEEKVHTLESQLHEISATCIKQVEEIESLKAENLKLHKFAEEREQLSALYDAKTRELETLQTQVSQLRAEVDNPSRLNALTQRMQRLQEEHATLSQRLTQAQQILKTVTTEKENVEKQFETLVSKISDNDAIISGLKERIDVLTRENETLKQKQNTVAKKAPVPPAAPRIPVFVRQPVAATKNALHAQAHAEPSVETPVSVPTNRRSAVQTEADLPEIRVAQPIEQEDLYNGEDFLEKTDSFIGRMKWSIFRDDN